MTSKTNASINRTVCIAYKLLETNRLTLTVTTGEEAEQTLYTCRTKLYNFVASAESGKKEWKERGVGTLRLNLLDQETPTGTTDDKDINDKTKPKAASKVKTRARLIMRADGSHRVVLNTPILREIKFGDASGAAPKSGLVYFMASVDGGKLELLQLKVCFERYL